MSWFKKDGYGVPAVLAVGLHLAIILAGIITINFGDDTPPAPKRPPIVHATVVDVSKTVIGQREEQKIKETQQKAELAKEKELAAKKKANELAQRKAFEAQKKQLAQAKEAQEIANRKAAEAAKKKQEAEEAKKEKAQEAAKQKQLAEQKAKADAAKKAEAAKKQAEEAKKKAEAAEEAKRQEAERQKQIAARKAEQERLAQEAARQAEAKAEAEKKAAAEAQMVQSISGLINNRIAAAWTRPPNARNNMKTTLRISFFPSGEVQDVQVVDGSGDALFDQRAVNAARNMGRIDELSKVDPYVFERNFRNVVIIFNPQDLRN